MNYSKVTHAEDFAAKMLRKARMAALETLRRGVGQGRQGPQRAGSRRLANSSIIRILAIVIDASFDRWTGDLTHTGPIYEEGVNRVTLEINL